MLLSNELLADLCSKLSYEFSDPELLSQALTHRSYCAEHADSLSNERLEFLGDSVLGLAVTSNIFTQYPNLSEGHLAKVRASVVSTAALSVIGEKLDLGSYLHLGKGEDQSGGRSKESILADAVEAIIGAVYVDTGWEVAERVVLGLTETLITEAAEEPGKKDYKTQLQELAARQDLGIPVYELQGSGPDHDKRFFAVITIGEDKKGEGSGTSKKRAEQEAAKSAYYNILGTIVKEDK